jgi:hypothetical protein
MYQAGPQAMVPVGWQAAVLFPVPFQLGGDVDALPVR